MGSGPGIFKELGRRLRLFGAPRGHHRGSVENLHELIAYRFPFETHGGPDDLDVLGLQLGRHRRPFDQGRHAAHARVHAGGSSFTQVIFDPGADNVPAEDEPSERTMISSALRLDVVHLRDVEIEAELDFVSILDPGEVR